MIYEFVPKQFIIKMQTLRNGTVRLLFLTNETLVNLYFECPLLHVLWVQFEENVRPRSGILVNIIPSACLVCILPSFTDCEMLNTFLVIIRHRIYMYMFAR